MRKPIYRTVDTDRFQDAEIVLQRLHTNTRENKIRIHKGDRYFSGLVAIGGVTDTTEEEILRGLLKLEQPTDVLWLPPDTYELEFTNAELSMLVSALRVVNMREPDELSRKLEARLRQELEA